MHFSFHFLWTLMLQWTFLFVYFLNGKCDPHYTALILFIISGELAMLNGFKLLHLV